MTGDPARWRAVEDLFDGALEQPAETREQWLERATTDQELRAIVARMLDAHAQDGGFLDRPIDVLPEFSFRQQLEQALGERYTIECEIGRGGMAIVYLARERKHDRQVVIKVLNPDASAAFGSRRFLDEIRVIAQLAHPNILPLLDSGGAVYTTAAPASAAPASIEFLYYVMPYLGGRTLRTHLRDEGRLPVELAIRILCDVAGALSTAHQAGIVHRDLKPENILLVGEHAYLLDFGIALLRRSGQLERHTGEGLAIGTVGYMAPEQSVGGRTTATADIYAWGVLARELLTGQPPDHFRTFLRTLPQGTPAGLAQLITDALADNPEARPTDGTALVERIARIEAGLAERPRRRTWPWVAASLLMLATTGWLLARGRRGMLDPAALPQPVAVQGFRNETGDSTLGTWGRLAGDWITQGLQEAGMVQVVPWTGTEDAEPGDAGGDPVARFRRETGAGTVITGSYYLVGGQIRFQAQVIDAVHGTVLAAPAPALAPRDSAEQALEVLRTRIMAALAIRTDEELGTIPGLAERPPTFEAYQVFDRGMRHHLAGEYDSAAADFRRAFALDTTFGIALVHAAFDLWNTGEYAAVDSLLRDLRRRQVPLARYHEQLGEYLRAHLIGDGTRALTIIRQASAAAPHARGRYTVAWAALSVNRPHEARALLASLDPQAGMLRNWAPYWTQRAHADHGVGDHASELASVRAMRLQHPDSRVAVVLEVRAAAALGRDGLVDTLLAAAAPLPPDTYWSYGAALVVAGEEYAAHGRAFLSNPLYNRAVSWFANHLTRNPASQAHRYWIGAALYDAGRWPEAAPYFASLVADHPDRTDYRGLAALCEARAGRLEEALALLGPRPRYNPGAHTIFRARITAVAGRQDEALTLLSQAAGEGYSSWPWFHAVAHRDVTLITNDPRYRRLLAGDAPTP